MSVPIHWLLGEWYPWGLIVYCDVFNVFVVACVDLTYGQNCNEKCPDRCYNKTCHLVTGACLFGCIKGWNNQQCYLRKFITVVSSNPTQVCDKICQWLAAGRWFSPGNRVSSTNKTDLHDLTEILLQMALNTYDITLVYYWSLYMTSLWYIIGAFIGHHSCILLDPL
jgi:hypothetical protein